MAINIGARWRDRSACAQVVEQEPILAIAFVNRDVTSNEARLARSICDSCRVRLDCLFDALRDEHSEGMRAGFYFEGGALRKKDAETIMERYGIMPRTRQSLPSKE